MKKRFYNQLILNFINCIFITGILFTFIFASSLMFVFNYVYLSLLFCFINSIQIYCYSLWRENYE